MSDETPRTRMDAVHEVQAIFPTRSSLDEALDALRMRGFDRHDLSLPDAAPRAAEATPEQGADTPTTETDRQQARVLGGSTAGVVAALGGAMVTVATGGAAAAAPGVAAAAGAVTGGVTHAALAAGGEAEKAEREAAAQSGELVLAVAVRDAERERVAVETLREVGATRIETVERQSGVVERPDTKDPRTLS